MKSAHLSVMRESYDKVDYAMVLNAQLNRIMVARSVVSSKSQLLGYRKYLDSVEALYFMLLPQLRGNAWPYIELANKILFTLIPALGVWNNLNCSGILEAGLEASQDKEKCLRLKKAIDQVVNDIGRFTDLPPTPFYEKLAVYSLDRALEIMVANMDRAGLLLRGKTVLVGAVG